MEGRKICKKWQKKFCHKNAQICPNFACSGVFKKNHLRMLHPKDEAFWCPGSPSPVGLGIKPFFPLDINSFYQFGIFPCVK